MGDPIVRTLASLHKLAMQHGICYVVAYCCESVPDEIKCSFNVKAGGCCSNFFASVVWYWVQMNFKTHTPWEEEVLPYASHTGGGKIKYCADQEAVGRAKTLLESIWKQQDFTEHKFMVVYAELSERETVFFEACPEEHTPPPVLNTLKWIKNTVAI